MYTARFVQGVAFLDKKKIGIAKHVRYIKHLSKLLTVMDNYNNIIIVKLCHMHVVERYIIVYGQSATHWYGIIIPDAEL